MKWNKYVRIVCDINNAERMAIYFSFDELWIRLCTFVWVISITISRIWWKWNTWHFIYAGNTVTVSPYSKDLKLTNQPTSKKHTHKTIRRIRRYIFDTYIYYMWMRSRRENRKNAVPMSIETSDREQGGKKEFKQNEEDTTQSTNNI